MESKFLKNLVADKGPVIDSQARIDIKEK